MLVLQFLLVAKVLSAIQRFDNGFKAEFSVVNKGRLYNTLMYFEELSYGDCLFECIRFLNCVTFNYHSERKMCELTDEDFDWYEADDDAPGWYNYGTPPKIDGGFSEWIATDPCSTSCGRGQQTQKRSCSTPEPKYGGADCVGERSRIAVCNLERPCAVDGGFSEWIATDPCSTSCGRGQQTQTRTCSKPVPKYQGADCVGERTRIVPCKNTKTCPIFACEGKLLELRCPTGKKIKITSASYGRSDQITCVHESMSNTNCHAPSSELVMKKACDGREDCSMQASPGNFGDPCGGTYKYLLVEYECK